MKIESTNLDLTEELAFLLFANERKGREKWAEKSVEEQEEEIKETEKILSKALSYIFAIEGAKREIHRELIEHTMKKINTEVGYGMRRSLDILDDKISKVGKSEQRHNLLKACVKTLYEGE